MRPALDHNFDALNVVNSLDAMPNLPVEMERPHLESLPLFPLPTEYVLRWYQPGDERLWLRLHELSDPLTPVMPDLFRRQFGDDEERLRQRQCYLVLAPPPAAIVTPPVRVPPVDLDEVVGTATAWMGAPTPWPDTSTHQPDPGWGRIHWVAILPAWQGQGLAKPLLAAVCQRLRDLGHTGAWLRTSTARLPAIRLYLRFGFVPRLTGAEAEKRWQWVHRQLAASH